MAVTWAGTQLLKQGTYLLPRMFQWAVLPGKNGGPLFHANMQDQKPTLQFPQSGPSNRPQVCRLWSVSDQMREET